jgi:Ca-activated chloride channel family protein
MVRPQMRLERKLPEFERHDLIVVLDRSASMRARDVRPSRIARAVLELKTFLRRKPDAIDRVGLVGFAGSSVVLSYLTRDVESLMFYLDWIEEDTTPFFGTDLGAALTSALEIERKDTRTTRKIFLVISDGDDQGKELPKMLARMREGERRVHTIGIGSDEESLMPVAYGDSPQEQFLRDDNGDLLTTRFSERTLRTIATSTGGRYYRSTSGSELLTAMQTIVRGEQRQVGWQTVTDDYDLHREALMAAGVAAALLLILL